VASFTLSEPRFSAAEIYVNVNNISASYSTMQFALSGHILKFTS